MIKYGDMELERKIAEKRCVICDKITEYEPSYCAGDCETCSVENCTLNGKPANVPLCENCVGILNGWYQLEKYGKVEVFLSKIPAVSGFEYPADKYTILNEIGTMDKTDLRSIFESVLGENIWQYMS